MAPQATTYDYRVGLANTDGFINQGYKVNGIIYVSSRYFQDMTSVYLGAGDLKTQTRQTLEDLDQVSAALSATTSDITEMVVYLAKPQAHVEPFNSASST